MPYTTVLVPRFVNAFLGVKISKVACGAQFTAALTSDGEVWCWGEGGCGQLGCGHVTKLDSPRLAAHADLPTGGGGFSGIACSWAHCLAVASESGEIYSWGLNAHGQLGHGDLKSRFEPQRIQSVQSTPFKFVSAGDHYSSALERDLPQATVLEPLF